MNVFIKLLKDVQIETFERRRRRRKKAKQCLNT